MAKLLNYYISFGLNNLELVWKVFYGKVVENIVFYGLLGFRFSFPLHGYDHAYVIADSDPMTLEFDMTADQLTYFMRRWSSLSKNQMKPGRMSTSLVINLRRLHSM